MSETPPYASPVSAMARQRLSASSLTSMILGILFCIPLIASLCAILLAIIGFRATRNGAMRGRGFAITGLVLGIVGLLGWTAIGGFVGFFVAASSAPRAVLHDFAANLTSGNTAAAFAESGPPITKDQLDTLYDEIMLFGTYVNLTCSGVNIHGGSSGEICELYGSMKFSARAHPFNSVLVKDGSGVWKVHGFHVY